MGRLGAGDRPGSAQDIGVDGRGRVLRGGLDGVEVFDLIGRPLWRLGSGINFGLAVTASDHILATQHNDH